MGSKNALVLFRSTKDHAMGIRPRLAQFGLEGSLKEDRHWNQYECPTKPGGRGTKIESKGQVLEMECGVGVKTQQGTRNT